MRLPTIQTITNSVYSTVNSTVNRITKNGNVQLLDADGFPIAGAGEVNTLSTGSMQAALLNDMIFGASMYLGRAFSEPSLRIVNDKNEPLEERIPLDDVLDCTYNPNIDSRGQLLKHTGRSVGVFGQEYLSKTYGSSGEIIGIHILPFIGTDVEYDTESTHIVSYNYAGKKYPAKDVIHVKGALSLGDNPLMAEIPLQTLLQQVALDTEATRYMRLVLQKLGIIGGLVMDRTGKMPKVSGFMQGDSDEDGKEAALKSHAERLNKALGELQDGKVVAWPYDSEIGNIALKPRDIQPLEVYRKVESKSASVFGIAAPLLHYEIGNDNSTYNNLLVMRKEVADTTMRDLWDTVSEQLTVEFDSMLPSGYRLAFNLEEVAALIEDKNVAAERMLKQAQAVKALVEANVEVEVAREIVGI